VFLEDFSKDYLLSLLNEAPNDNMGQTDTMQNSNPNATYEPQEQDASMGVENSTGDEAMDPGMEEMDMGGEGGDPSMDGMDGGMDSGASMGMDPSVNTKDLFKKRKLFTDYKDLLSSLENLMDVSANMISKDLPEDAKKVYTFINHKMDENKEKLIIILTEQYFNLSYKQLLTIYMYIKMATKLYADMIKQLNDLYSKEK